MSLLFIVEPNLWTMTIDFVTGELRLAWNKQKTDLTSQLILTHIKFPGHMHWPNPMSFIMTGYVFIILTVGIFLWNYTVYCDTQKLKTPEKLMCAANCWNLPTLDALDALTSVHTSSENKLHTASAYKHTNRFSQWCTCHSFPACENNLHTHNRGRTRTHTFSICSQQKEISPRGKRDWKRKHENDPNVQMFLHFCTTPVQLLLYKVAVCIRFSISASTSLKCK